MVCDSIIAGLRCWERGEREWPGLVLSHITQKVPKENECYTEVEGYE